MNTVINKSEVKSPLREVRLRVAVCFAMIMLSSDSLNPVKLVCGVTGINTLWCTILFSILFLVILSANAKELTYFMTKVFMHSIFSIFFSSMEVLGRENIPEHGPVIFSGNHMNQFVDGGIVMVTAPHPVGFLVAKKSFEKLIIGTFAKAVGSIPVSRPQDIATAGPGKITMQGLKLLGENTKFTALQKGDRIRPAKSPEAFRLKQTISDTEAILAEDIGEATPLHELCQNGDYVTYDILNHVDQSSMFEAVQAELAGGKCLGIFPEGGSHDRTDLLPLKAGVAAIALGVEEKYHISVPIVPVGLNYFRGHRFRGRVVIEFGAPIVVSRDVFEAYQHGNKREAYQQMLGHIEEGMRSVIVTASDYNELKLIHTVRRLYQRSSSEMSTKDKQDLARRFSVAFKLLKEHFKHGKAHHASMITDGKDSQLEAKNNPNYFLPDDLQRLVLKLESYQDKLDYWGLKDYQLLTAYVDISYSKLLYKIAHGVIVLTLASIPSLLLNAPVGFAANYFAYREAQKDLKASRVKIQAKDVLLSKKIIFSLVAVPALWLFYGLLLVLFTNWKYQTIFVVIVSFPLFSYLGVMAVEAGMTDIKDIRPAILRLMPAFKTQAIALPRLRQQLQQEVREMVKKYGPLLGPVYFEKSSQWEQLLKQQHLQPDDNESMVSGQITTDKECGMLQRESSSSLNNLQTASVLLNNITSLGEEGEASFTRTEAEINNSGEEEDDLQRKKSV